MSGGTQESVREPTVEELSAHVGYLTRMAKDWAEHPELGLKTADDLAQFRGDYPEAAALHDRQVEDENQRVDDFFRQITESIDS